MNSPEETRLRAALVDIAAGGGWQGRYAQAVLDVIQVEAETAAAAPMTPRDLVQQIREEARRQGLDLSQLGGA